MARHASTSPAAIRSPSETGLLVSGVGTSNPFNMEGWALSPARCGAGEPTSIALASPGFRVLEGKEAETSSPMGPIPANKLLPVVLSPRASPRFAALQSPLAPFGSPLLRAEALLTDNNPDSIMSPLRHSEVA